MRRRFMARSHGIRSGELFDKTWGDKMKLCKGRIGYKLPIEIYKILSVNISNNTGKYLHCLHQVSERVFTDNDVIGHPQFFQVKDGKILFQPVPDKAYTATIRYTVIKEI